jgi:hypothetical protein
LIDVCSTGPASDIQAGDWYIASADCDIPSNQWFGLGSVKANDRIIYSGVKWETFAPPNVPYADEALGDVPLDADSKPSPDNRMGGIVKNATLSQALACTDKCDTITPYTLCEVIEDKLDDFKDTLVSFENTKAETVTVSIAEGSPIEVCIQDTLLFLTAQAVATAADGNPAIGRWRFQWYETTTGTDVPLSLVRSEAVTGGTSETLRIENFVISPDDSTRSFKVKATFIDLYGEETEAESAISTLSYINAISLNSQPVNLDLSGDTTTGNFQVSINQQGTDLAPIVPTYQWTVNNVDITGANEPDIGYTFSNWTTNTLTVVRDSDSAGSYSVGTKVIGGCQPLITSNNALLIGPGAQTQLAPAPAPQYINWVSPNSWNVGSSIAWPYGPPQGTGDWTITSKIKQPDSRYAGGYSFLYGATQ